MSGGRAGDRAGDRAVGRVVIVGGGITGLAAAWELTRSRPDVVVTVVEASDRWGGKIKTGDFGGKPIDRGPDAFLARVPWAAQLCAELGLADDLVAPSAGGAWLATPSGPRRIPEGLVLGVPARTGPLLRSRLLSPLGLARAGLEPFLPGTPSPHGTGDSVGATIRRRFGREVHERLVDPLVGSINAADTDHLSLAAAVPQLSEVAGRSRSLLLGLRASARAAAAAAPSGAPAPVFLTHPAGLGHVVATLVERLAAAGVDLRTATPVAAVRARTEGGADVELAGPGSGEVLGADAVVVATPADVASASLAGAAPGAAELLARIPYAGVAIVTMALEARRIGRPLEGSGVLVPRDAPGDGLMTALSFGSAKWAHWATPGQVLLRLSVGRFGDTRALDLDDDALVDRLHGEVGRLLEGVGPADEVRVDRWPSSFPQYLPGHLDRVGAIERALADELPGVVVAGAAYRGLGIPACIRQGREAATAVLARVP